jgi:hypothetical protein
MGKSRRAAASGLGSLALLLAECGGSSSLGTAASGTSAQSTASPSYQRRGGVPAGRHDLLPTRSMIT